MQTKKSSVFFQESGQTIIETVIAIFILVSGIAAAVGLAVFAFATSQNINKQIIGVGLARQGIEAVKNMRDTNWLKIPNIDSDCYNFETADNTAKCYKQWLNPANGYNLQISGNQARTFRLRFNPTDVTGATYWNLILENNNFGLNFDPNITAPVFEGFYFSPQAAGPLNGSSEYYRKITLRTDGPNIAPPFNTATNGPRVQVISQVWWTDKKCPRVADWPGLGKCSVELQTYLTNWKNY